MAHRTGHGTGRGQPRIEVLPPDELPEGLPEDAGPSELSDHGSDGRFQPGNHASVEGGRRKAGALTLARKLGLSEKQQPEFAPYLKHAENWRRHKVNELAQTVGSGYCGAGPSSIIATAARQLASSMHLFDLAAATGGPDMQGQSSTAWVWSYGLFVTPIPR